MGLGLLCGVCVCAYSLNDAAGVQHADPIQYFVAMGLLTVALLLPLLLNSTHGRETLKVAVREKKWAWRRRRRAGPRASADRDAIVFVVVVGVGGPGCYLRPLLTRLVTHLFLLRECDGQ